MEPFFQLQFFIGYFTLPVFLSYYLAAFKPNGKSFFYFLLFHRFHKKIFYPHPERMKRKIKITFMAAATSEPSINMVRAEETQTEENTAQTSELPIKTLTQKVIDENPYMAASDSNIHHDCYNTDSTDEVFR